MATLQLPQLLIDTVTTVTQAARPILLNRDPGPRETDVPLDATIAFDLVDVGTAGIDRTATQVFVDGVLAFDGRTAAGIAPAFTGPGSSVVESVGTLRMVLHPLIPFPSQAEVTVRVVSQTRDGQRLDVTYFFEVEDRTAPRLLAAQATGQKTLRVGFDEPVLVPPEARWRVLPVQAPAVPVEVARAVADGSIVVLQLLEEMTPDVTYELVASGVTDLSGNQVLTPFDQARFPGYRPASPPGRRFRLWEMLPKHCRRDDQTGDLAKFIGCLQEITDLLLADADRWPDIFDVERAPAPFLDPILRDLGNPFPFDLDTLGKRRLALVLCEMYRQKGTAVGIRNAIRFFLGVDVVVTAFVAEVMVLGESELGVDWVLGPSQRFSRYAFNIEVSRVLTGAERKHLRAIVDLCRPAHTHFVELIDPHEIMGPDHWELGMSELGGGTAMS